MADGRRRRNAKQARRDAGRSRSREHPPGTPEEVSLIGEVGEAIDGGHPLEFLDLVSTLILGTMAHPLQKPEEQPPAIGELVAAFIDMPAPETTALLAALAEMLIDDDGLRARCRRAVDARDDTLPGWLADLNHTTVHRAVRMTHVLGDGDEVLLGVRFTDGQEMTCVAFIDRSTSHVGDAFFVPDSIESVLRVARANNTDPDTTFAEQDLGDARAELQQALDQPLFGLSREDSDTWPASWALVRWLSRLMFGHGMSIPATQ